MCFLLGLHKDITHFPIKIKKKTILTFDQLLDVTIVFNQKRDPQFGVDQSFNAKHTLQQPKSFGNLRDSPATEDVNGL